jgi:endonuclease/exonuclease/phosphatase family metal-dependent hydrolase
MHAFEKPTFDYDVDLPSELQRVRAHQQHRGIPAATDANTIIATWNLANFGLQEREDVHLAIMAEVIKPFDVVAIQEVADDITQLDTLVSKLGGKWEALYTDIAGNDERLGFLYRSDRVTPLQLAAELAMRRYEQHRIVIEDIVKEFEGFNRNPYMMNFRAGEFEFTLVNVHLYWSSFQVRQLETEALGEWAAKRVTKDFPPHNDIILLGDFNMPKLAEDDPIYTILHGHGLQVPKYDTELVGTNLAGDKHYDELAFFPGRTENDFTGAMGVFDFDKVIFPDLWDPNDKGPFFKYARYYIADHRPLWAEFRRTST